MKIFIPSYNRATTIRTHVLLKKWGLNFAVVLHNEKEKQDYLAGSPLLLEEDIIVSNAELGISNQRNWIRDNLVEKDEWFIMMDDNIEDFNIIPCKTETFDRSNKALRIPYENNMANDVTFFDAVRETINKAEEIGTGFCGFATIENYFFRNKKWKTISMICTKCCLVKNDELRYNPKIKTMDDYDYSVKAMLKYGKVLVNAYVWPKAKHNQAGGLGKLKERSERKIEDCKYLMHHYAGLFRYKDRKNSVPGAEIVLRSHTAKFFQNWKERYEKVKDVL